MAEAISLEEFEVQARVFLAAHAAPRTDKDRPWGEGSDSVAIMPETSGPEEALALAEARAWRARRFEAGFGAIRAPKEYGGRRLDLAYEHMYEQLERRFDVPSQIQLAVGLGMVAPTILAHGSALLKSKYLHRIWGADIVACQLFSEPGAGSDLAGMQTRARRDGDTWLLSGQKVWTSGAHFSDIGLIIARTDPAAAKHQGLTAFIIDMRAPGVEVRPLRQMTGGASFNEVFVTDVRVPDDHRLGEPGQGWQVILTTLMNERAAIGSGIGAGTVPRLLQLARHLGRDTDPVLRQQLMACYIHDRVANLNNARALAAIETGRAPGPEHSIAKLAFTQNVQRAAALATALLGPRLMADSGEWGTYAWAEFVLGAPGLRLAGGTDEVMRNVLAERVLGLPKEPSAAGTPS